MAFYFYTNSGPIQAFTEAVFHTGTIVMSANFVTGSPPAGWHECNGQLLDKILYNDLFLVIGIEFGDSGSDFLLPDFSGLFPRGVISGADVGTAGTGGTKTHTHTLFGHTHTANTHRHNTTVAGFSTHVHDVTHTHKVAVHRHASDHSTGLGDIDAFTQATFQTGAVAASDVVNRVAAGSPVGEVPADSHNHSLTGRTNPTPPAAGDIVPLGQPADVALTSGTVALNSDPYYQSNVDRVSDLTTPTTSNPGSIVSTVANNLPPYMALTFLIKD